MLEFFVVSANGQEKIPSTAELDSVMQNAVRQMNSQMTGTKVDDYTTLKFVTYDMNPPMLSYFYSSNVLSVLGLATLNKNQIEAMKKVNVNKACSFKLLMKPYGFKVAHIFSDSNSGKIIYKLTVSYSDC
jgi:hypothetical protein